MGNKKFATLALHTDDDLSQGSDVAPPMHLSTTFPYSDIVTEVDIFADSSVS